MAALHTPSKREKKLLKSNYGEMIMADSSQMTTLLLHHYYLPGKYRLVRSKSLGVEVANCVPRLIPVGVKSLL